MNTIGIIPARLGSTRFPNKPLRTILGIPMVAHCYERSKMSVQLNDVVVAGCDAELEEYCKAHDIAYVATSDKHERATERCAEAVEIMEQKNGKKYDVVVMIQGDEPMVMPEMIDVATKAMVDDPSIKVVNLMAPLTTQEEQDDPNEVKVVVDLQDFALYFSREPIPSRKKFTGEITAMKQVCIMPFNRDFLVEYGKLTPTPLEKIESVDMNRVLEHGMKVKMVREDFETASVDTPEDLQHVEAAMANDVLLPKYKAKYQ